MKKIRIVAIITAVLLAISVFLYIRNLNKQEEIQRVSVVAASVDILPDTQITQDMLTTVELPVEAVHSNAVLIKSTAVGKMTTSHILKDEVILENKLHQPGESTAGLAYTINEGMRAITVAVDKVSGLSGLLKPGDFVDIIVVLTVEFEEQSPEGEREVTTDTIQETLSSQLMSNIEILAVGTSLDKTVAASQEDPYDTVTLSVTPNQALYISLAEKLGYVRMSLRSPLDGEEMDYDSVLVDDLFDDNSLIEKYGDRYYDD